MIVVPDLWTTVFDDVLSRANDGHTVRLSIRDEFGFDHPMDARSWCRRHVPGDRALLGRCSGPTLDVGCGPGRLTSSLNRLGHPALGIDISEAAVRLARSRGATVLRRDVFAALPGHGRWRHLLLADGNIGIGGDPERLLRRCRELVGPGGRIHVELARPGTRSWAGEAWSAASDDRPGVPVRWAVLAADDVAAVAGEVALRVRDSWTEAGRWFATLSAA